MNHYNIFFYVNLIDNETDWNIIGKRLRRQGMLAPSEQEARDKFNRQWPHFTIEYITKSKFTIEDGKINEIQT